MYVGDITDSQGDREEGGGHNDTTRVILRRTNWLHSYLPAHIYVDVTFNLTNVSRQNFAHIFTLN